MLYIVENLNEHLIIADTFSDRVRVAVGAVVDDAIHIQVETIELGNAVLGDQLRDSWVALREPAEEFRNTWFSSVEVVR